MKKTFCRVLFISDCFIEKLDRREMSMAAKTQESDVSVAAEPQQLSASYQQVAIALFFELLHSK